jgi:hypothetical protein
MDTDGHEIIIVYIETVEFLNDSLPTAFAHKIFPQRVYEVIFKTLFQEMHGYPFNPVADRGNGFSCLFVQ